ncbi:MAG: hypothetical protein R3324_03385 [Halobacteriales archaeon]|nr:hypothetical protein [Halobacteriales archaeon]
MSVDRMIEAMRPGPKGYMSITAWDAARAFLEAAEHDLYPSRSERTYHRPQCLGCAAQVILDRMEANDG